jgi:hypothetical protein
VEVYGGEIVASVAFSEISVVRLQLWRGRTCMVRDWLSLALPAIGDQRRERPILELVSARIGPQVLTCVVLLDDSIIDDSGLLVNICILRWR